MGKASKEFLSQFVRGEKLKDNLVEVDGKPALDMWHGGAPNIEKFDMSQMGTGEGAQMYSPGLYHAGRRGTSKSYRDQYSNKLQSKINNSEGGAIVGDIDLAIRPRNWARVQQVIKENTLETQYEKEMLVEALTNDLADYGNYLKDEVALLDPKDYERVWREEDALANLERLADANGEATYAQEMEYQYGPDWRDDPDLVEEFREDTSMPSWGFLRDDITRTQKIHVYVTTQPDGTIKAEWEDGSIGTRTFIYPAGTDKWFIQYSQDMDHTLWRGERTIANAPPHLYEKHKLAYEVEPDKFEFIDPREIEVAVTHGGDPDFRTNNNPFGVLNDDTPQAISGRRMTADGRIIEMHSPEYAEHLHTATKDISETTLSDIDKVAYNIYQGAIPQWNTALYGPEPDFTNLRGGLYKTRLNVNPDELLDWFEPINEQPKALQDLINKYLDAKELLDDGWGADTWLTDKERKRLLSLTGEGFFGEMARKFGWIEFRDDMDKVGMPGMLYRDWTRDFSNKRPTYNVVMYNDKPIDILERGAANAPFLASVFGITSTALTAAALSQKPDLISPPVLDKEIAEQFPMPEREVGMLEQVGSNPNVQAAMHHPLTQYLGMQIENSDLPARVAPAVAEGMFNLSQGNSLSDTGQQFVDRMKTPYDQTMDEVGKYVLKETGSPAASTAAYMGMFAGDITNWIGP